MYYNYSYIVQKIFCVQYFYNKLKFLGETPNRKNEKSTGVKSEYFKETKAVDIFGSEPVKRAPPRKFLKAS